MENEITVQDGFSLVSLKVEINELKKKLSIVSKVKPSTLDDSLYSPDKFDHYKRVAMTLAKSSLVPVEYIGKPENIFVAMAMAYSLGLPVELSLNDISVIRGRPCLWGDGLWALILRHPECEYTDEEKIYKNDTIFGYKCTIKRKGHPEYSQTFTLEDARRAGLLGKAGAWTNYEPRMLQHRARGYCARDKFADALRGLRIAEIEQEDNAIIDVQSEEIQNGLSHTDKLKNIFSSKDKSYAIKEDPNDDHLEILKTKKDEIQNSKRVAAPGKSPIDNFSKNIEVKSEKISPEEIDKIEKLMEEKYFTDAKKQKTLKYFNVTTLEDLTKKQASIFFNRLGKLV